MDNIKKKIEDFVENFNKKRLINTDEAEGKEVRDIQIIQDVDIYNIHIEFVDDTMLSFHAFDSIYVTEELEAEELYELGYISYNDWVEYRKVLREEREQKNIKQTKEMLERTLKQIEIERTNILKKLGRDTVTSS